MRLSDILKKNSQKPGERETASQEISASRQAPAEPEQAAPAQTPQAIPPIKHTSSISAEEAYTKAIIEIKNIISCVEKNIPYTSAIECVQMFVELIGNDNANILLLADRATPDIFLYGHCVNLCIFSLFLGKGFNFSQDKLLELGFCALLNDVGLSKLQQGAKGAEASAQKHQNLQAQDLVKKLPDITEDIKTLILEVMLQKQNQKNLAAYPDSIKGTDIHNFARIIAVADVYETLTHPRPNRDRMLPHEALKSMIGTASPEYDSEILRLFLERISLYPPGSYVRLNSEEIGRVIGLNKGLPTRPKVKVIVDSSKQRIDPPKIIDLAACPMIFIKEAVDETRLNLPDKKLSLELKAVRWWVKGL